MRRSMLVFFILLILSCSAPLLAQEKTGKEAGPAEHARQMMELLIKQDYAAFINNCDEKMKAALPLEKLQEVWKGILLQAGKFKKQGEAKASKVGEYDVVVIECEFENASLDVTMSFNAAQQISGLFFRPSQKASAYVQPSYVDPSTFREKEVVVGEGEWKLPATLTIPNGSGPFPVLVLIHGSGPQDRDESIGPNKPFRDLALGLASRGIAVLRYEKRTKELPQKLLPLKDKITVKEEVVDDVLAAVSLLRTLPEVNKKKIFLLGHSLGGMLLPRIGTLVPDASGLIVLAGTTRPLEDVIVEQIEYISMLDGSLSEDEKKQLEELKKQAQKVKSAQLTLSTAAAELPLGLPASYWLDLRGYDPPKAAQSLKQPMLILQGGRDYQVTEKDFDRWQKALSSRPNVSFKFYPKLNHLFIEGEGKIAPEEYMKGGHVSEEVIKDISAWIKEKSV